jgi:hypothetical protein
MLGLSPWVSLLAVTVAAAASWLTPRVPRGERSVSSFLHSGWAPAIAGLLSGAITLWVWRSLSRTPVMHDEAAYLLQAELFASGRWTGSAPALPEFFQQLYVLIDPVVASKYPPGHSLLLALGALVGLPALPVVLMNGLSGALVYSLARRSSGPVTAVLTWIIWMTSFPVVYYRANYMSQSTTSFLWLLAWWALWRWRARPGDGRWLLLVAAAVSWSAITRPMTALALGTAVGAVVLHTAWSKRRWRELAPGVALGIAILALVPLWNWRTTGRVTLTPLSLYTQRYVPFDKPGFGVAANARPSNRLPRDQWITSASFYQEHARHTLRTLPRTAAERLTYIANDAWHDWRGGLRAFALVGLLLLPAEGLVVLSAFALQFLLYLSYAHPARWTIYYVECAPVFAFISALGIARVMKWASRTAPRDADATVHSFDGVHRLLAWRRAARQRGSEGTEPFGALLATAMLVLAATAAGRGVLSQVRTQIDADHQFHEAFDTLVGSIADPSAVVFVRYGPDHNDGLSLVRNAAARDDAPVWTVYDRGPANARLLAMAPQRVPYLFDETSWTLRRLQRPAAPERNSGVASGRVSEAPSPRR